MLRLLLLLFALVALSRALGGVPLGSLQSESWLGLGGRVALADSKHVIIRNFKINTINIETPLNWRFLVKSAAGEYQNPQGVYQYVYHANGNYLRPVTRSLDKYSASDLVVALPQNTINSQWQSLVIYDEQAGAQGAVNIGAAQAPQATYNIPNLQLIEYDVGSSKITAISDKEIKIEGFTFKGSAPPDGWWFAGRRSGPRINKRTGHKLFYRQEPSTKNTLASNHSIITPSYPRRCAMHRDFGQSGDSVTKIVTLPDRLTVFDINYLSVFCFQYGIDFGSTPATQFRGIPQSVVLPVYLPPIRNRPFPAEKCTL